MKIIVIAALTACAGSTIAVAQTQKPLPLEAQEQIGHAKKALDELKKFEALVDGADNEKREQCIRSFGDETFCNCISAKTALILSFAGYIAVTSHDKDEIKYGSLSDTDKKIVDAARSARDVCVAGRHGQ